MIPAALRALVLCLAAATVAANPQHHAIEATLHVPYRAPDGQQRTLLLQAQFPGAPSGTVLLAELQVRAPDGVVVDSRAIELALVDGRRSETTLPWPPAGLPAEHLAAGIYRAELRATAFEPWLATRLGSGAERVRRALASAPNGVVEQDWEFQVGTLPRPILPAFAGLARPGHAVAVPGPFPYTAYLFNLHSQSNHSDGGGNVATCSSSQGPQDSEFGPADGYAYARDRGLDGLLVSEHNHYYDGTSNSASSSALPATVNALFQSGLAAAAQFRQQHPDFLALYGMEWGVISGGGHLNILGAGGLWNWEFNGQNQLLGELFTARSDYPALYAAMKAQQVLGQFNHPETSGQFLVDGTALGYHPDGDEVMVLAEVLNTSAFSNNTTETETGQSSFQGAWNRLLERGWHVAPASNQDNHCANWGASLGNRTAVLLPNGTALDEAAFMAALRARRVYATTDKTSQLVLQAGSHIMGERFSHSGPLTLTAHYFTSGASDAAQVQFFEGVPGRNGTVTLLASTAVHTFTPTPGEHFYYAKVTQLDGRLLWSAPVWVMQTVALPDPLFASGFE